MSTRRGFLAQLVGAIAAGFALPKLLRAEARIERGGGCAYIKDGGYEARIAPSDDAADAFRYALMAERDYGFRHINAAYRRSLLRMRYDARHVQFVEFHRQRALSKRGLR